MATLDTTVIARAITALEGATVEGLQGTPSLVVAYADMATHSIPGILDDLRNAFGFETVERGPKAAQLVEDAWRQLNWAEGFFRRASETGRIDLFDQGYWGLGAAAEILDDPILN